MQHPTPPTGKLTPDKSSKHLSKSDSRLHTEPPSCAPKCALNNTFSSALEAATTPSSPTTRVTTTDDFLLRAFNERICEWMARVSEEETSATISGMLSRTGEILCPHSAIAARIGDQHQNGATPMISLATAHPAKFPDAVEAATGIRPGLPKRMADLYDRSERVTRVQNDLNALETLIQERIAR